MSLGNKSSEIGSPESTNIGNQITLGLTTYYGTDENSNLRIQLFKKSLQAAQKLGLKVIVVDGGSTHPDFEGIIEKYKDIVDVISGVTGIGNQTRILISNINEKYRGTYILKTEPEKYSLLTADTLYELVKIAHENPHASYISPTRDLENSKLPKSLNLAEKAVGKQVNEVLKRANEKIFTKIHDGSVSEGAGSLFGPVLITTQGVDAILSSEEPAWGTWFFPRIIAAMEGKSFYYPVGYTYDETEIKKENDDMKKLWKFCKNQKIRDEIRDNLKQGNVQQAMSLINLQMQNKHFDLVNNLAFKRLKQYVDMLTGLSNTINSK